MAQRLEAKAYGHKGLDISMGSYDEDGDVHGGSLEQSVIRCTGRPFIRDISESYDESMTLLRSWHLLDECCSYDGGSSSNEESNLFFRSFSAHMLLLCGLCDDL